MIFNTYLDGNNIIRIYDNNQNNYFLIKWIKYRKNDKSKKTRLI